jgi:hypothetical protein
LLAGLDGSGCRRGRLTFLFSDGETVHLGAKLRAMAEAVLSGTTPDGWCSATRSDLAVYLGCTLRHVARLVQALRAAEILAGYDIATRRYRVTPWVAFLSSRRRAAARCDWRAWSLPLKAALVTAWRQSACQMSSGWRAALLRRPP